MKGQIPRRIRRPASARVLVSVAHLERLRVYEPSGTRIMVAVYYSPPWCLHFISSVDFHIPIAIFPS